MGKNGSLTYADSGVNIDTGNQVVSAIKSIIKDTHNDSVLSNIGGLPPGTIVSNLSLSTKCIMRYPPGFNQK